MYIAYYDEAGDDGYPGVSPLFILSALYVYYLNWKDVIQRITEFRRQLKIDFGLPVKMEIHTRHFLLNKSPYRAFSISNDDRLLIIDLYCELIAQLDVKIVNVAINKSKITSADYAVLNNALTYSIQRIENDLKRIDPTKRFMIITDEGRVGKMRKTSRQIQRFNFIPSKYGGSYREEIKSLIEDPLPKKSQESYLIQTSDLVSYIVHLYLTQKHGVGRFPRRLPNSVNPVIVIEWMDKMKDSLNLEASSADPYGVVCYPR